MSGSSAARVLVVEHEPGCPLGRLPLPGVDVEVVRPWRGEAVPADASACAGLVVLGGRVAAWEDDAAPWLPATRALLASAAAGGVPVLGICLGAQLLALATGGRVERGAAGPEVGMLQVTAAPAAERDALLGGLVGGPVGGLVGGPVGGPARDPGGAWLAAQSHRDAVTALPADAVLLASSAAYPVQAFRVGERAWGVQYHPEVTPDVYARWLDGHAGSLAARGTGATEQLAVMAEHDRDLVALARAHGRAVARGAGARAGVEVDPAAPR